MLFDTGSSEFWIPSDDCVTDVCISHRRYKKTESYEPSEK